MTLYQIVIEKCKCYMDFTEFRLQAYSDGINDFVKSMVVYPIEFYIMWIDFEEWTPYDSLTVTALLQYFITFDWFLELTRSRMTEIYDKD